MPQTLSREAAIDAAVNALLELVDTQTPTPVLIIDGRSGSGKTTLAAEIQQRLFKEGESLPRVVHMDDLYPGWHGLQAGHDYLVRKLLKPLGDGAVASWQEYNWELGERQGWREFGGGTPLIIEGCGSLSSQTTPSAHLRIWVETPDDLRQKRWIDRVGNSHDEWWPVWASQELDFYSRERSAELADLICTGV